LPSYLFQTLPVAKPTQRHRTQQVTTGRDVAGRNHGFTGGSNLQKMRKTTKTQRHESQFLGPVLKVGAACPFPTLAPSYQITRHITNLNDAHNSHVLINELCNHSTQHVFSKNTATCFG
jgi:hypothetical protein